MKTKSYKGMLFAVFILTGCTVKGYQGLDLPDEQLATVQLKAPTISLIPLFWIFPLNMIAWQDDDWYETTWMKEIKVNDIELNRFKTILLKPENVKFHAMKTHILNVEKISGTERTSYGNCCCTETENQDKKKTKTCQRTITTTWNTIVRARDALCDMEYQVEANKHYQVFMRNEELMLQDDKLNIIKKNQCKYGSSYTYDSTDSSSYTESCWS